LLQSSYGSPIPNAEDPAGQSSKPPFDRVLSVAVAIALVGVTVQTLVHLVNAAVDGGTQLNVNAEHNAMAWAGSAAMFSAAFAAALHAILMQQRQLSYAFLASVFAFFSLDEVILVHERLAAWALGVVGVSTSWDSVLWPVLYSPVAGLCLVLLLALARGAPARCGRFIRIGLVLLVTAVTAEMVSAPVSTFENADGWPHIVEGAFEEGAELAGWILIAAGLMASTLFDAVRNRV
jgi:hypothetical protein